MRDKNSLSQSLRLCQLPRKLPLPSAPVGRAASSPSQSKPVGFDSSPKGRALGSPRKLHLFAKASPFGRGGCERSEQTERARLLPAVPPLPQEASAANAACRRDFFRKKAVPKRPQAFRNCNNKVYFPLICPPAERQARLSGRADGSPLRQRSRPRAARTGRWRSPRPGGRVDSAAPARWALRFPADGR